METLQGRNDPLTAGVFANAPQPDGSAADDSNDLFRLQGRQRRRLQWCPAHRGAPGLPASHWWDLSAQPRAGDQLLWLEALHTLDRRRPGPGRWLREARTRLRLAVERCRRRSGRSLGQIFEGYGVMLVSLASYRSPPKARRKRCCCQSRIGQEAGARSAQWLDDRQRMTKTLIGSSKSK